MTDLQWCAFLSDRFFADRSVNERFLDDAMCTVMNVKSTLNWSTILELRDDLAMQLYENHVFSQFHSLPIHTSDIYVRYAKQVFDTANGMNGLPKEVLRIALMAWMEVEDGKKDLASLEREISTIETHSCGVSEITPLTPRSQSEMSDISSHYEEPFSEISQTPPFYEEKLNDRKRTASMRLTNENTLFSAVVPSEIGEVVEEIYKLRKVCDAMTQEVFAKSPWIGGMYLEDWDTPVAKTVEAATPKVEPAAEPPTQAEVEEATYYGASGTPTSKRPFSTISQ